jgi:MoxR-like ATPase
MSTRELLEMRALVREVPIAGDLLRRCARLVLATDPRGELASDDLRRLVRYGASPRGAQALVLLAKARALTSGRPWVTEEDLAELCVPALRHRLVKSYEAEASEEGLDRLVLEAWRRSEP